MTNDGPRSYRERSDRLRPASKARLVCALLLLVACSGKSEGGGGVANAGGSTSGGSAAGVTPGGQGGLSSAEMNAGGMPAGGQSGVVPGEPAVLCSPDPPSGSCEVPGQNCTYGDAKRPDCRLRLFCEGGRWVNVSETCLPPPLAGCPASPPAGPDCDEGVCDYPDGTICDCFQVTPSGPPKLTCTKAPTVPECPTALPNLGTACTVEALECSYGNPCLPSGARVICRSGVWVSSLANCSF